MPATTILDTTKSHDGAAVPPPPRMPVAAWRGDKGDDSHDFAIPSGHVFGGCVLDVQDGRYDHGARITAQPDPGATGNARIDVHWYFDGGTSQSFVRYRITATAVPLAELVPQRKVRGFLPSSSGLHFTNNFDTVTVSFSVGPVTVPLQGANGGACGGMAFLVRDHFEAGFLVPPDTGNEGPTSGPLFDAIMNRLRDSFDLPDGPWRYLQLMDPNLPDASWSAPDVTIPVPPGTAPLPVGQRRGRGALLREAWQQIRDDIDGDRLAAIGLVLVRSANPLDIANNHQVLAWGYTAVSDREGTMFLYDPNFPDDDHITLSFRIASDDTVVQLRSPYPTTVGFFRNRYSRVTPSRPASGRTVDVALKASNGKFVVAEGGGGSVVNANRTQALQWERFVVERTASGNLRSGELVNLRASTGHYVVAEDRGGWEVNANRTAPFQWERFVVDRVGSDPGDEIRSGDRVTLRTDGDNYLMQASDVVLAAGSRPDEPATHFTITLL